MQRTKFHLLKKNIMPVVSMDAENFTYLSVYYGKKHYSARLKRVTVMFTKETCLLDCRCCDRKINCIHKPMAMWFLKQTEQLSRPWSQTIGVNQTDNRELMTKNCESPLYPPIDEELLLRMIKYLHNSKKYDQATSKLLKKVRFQVT